MPIPDQSSYNSNYASWKEWHATDFGTIDRSEQSYLAAELKAAGVLPLDGRRILEIGFGNGGFLAYMKEQQADVVGTEANEELVQRAREAGLSAHFAIGLDGFADGEFDLVAALDVLEHIPQDDLPAFLMDVARILKPGGRFLARFPNGDSPFGLAVQNGDVTHITALGSAKIRFLAAQAGLRICRVGAPAPNLMDPDFKRRLLKLARWLPRKIVEKTVKMFFFPSQDIEFFSSNLVVVAERDPANRPGV